MWKKVLLPGISLDQTQCSSYNLVEDIFWFVSPIFVSLWIDSLEPHKQHDSQLATSRDKSMITSTFYGSRSYRPQTKSAACQIGPSQIGPKSNRPKVKSAPNQIGFKSNRPQSNRPHFCCLLLSTCRVK
jgi:hypothetical protein